MRKFDEEYFNNHRHIIKVTCVIGFTVYCRPRKAWYNARFQELTDDEKSSCPACIEAEQRIGEPKMVEGLLLYSRMKQREQKHNA